MKCSFKTYGLLFLYTLKISAFTFGGGYVIVSLMKKQFVDKLGWLNDDEMLDFSAVIPRRRRGQCIHTGGK